MTVMNSVSRPEEQPGCSGCCADNSRCCSPSSSSMTEVCSPSTASPGLHEQAPFNWGADGCAQQPDGLTPNGTDRAGDTGSDVEEAVSMPEGLQGDPPPALHPAPGTKAALQTVLHNLRAHVTDGTDTDVNAVASRVIHQHKLDDTFYVMDLGIVKQLYDNWVKLMPSVEVYYAVKCNPDIGLVAMLAALGAGFDCATEAEIKEVMSLGVPTDKIIYAHPCKPAPQLKFAARAGVQYTTFDTVCELHKLAALHPTCNAVLRIRADDPTARCCLGNKYGAEPHEVPVLLQTAHRLGLNVMGVSFHVGSGATNPAAFEAAIAAARRTFDMATALGFRMSLLDLGGGFSGGFTPKFPAVAEAINRALAAYFPTGCGVRVMAEPGRYFAEHVGTLAVVVNGLREQVRISKVSPTPSTHVDYWVSDGIYGSFNCIMYDHPTLTPRILRAPGAPRASPGTDALVRPTTLFGPTCDGMDKVVVDVPLHGMQPGDWVLFADMGAYTIAGACNFNGFDAIGAKRFYVFAEPGANSA